MGNYKKPSHLRQKMLENIPYLKPSLNIPNYHHERWDGSGYLQGLSQNDIPFTARIIQWWMFGMHRTQNGPIVGPGRKTKLAIIFAINPGNNSVRKSWKYSLRSWMEKIERGVSRIKTIATTEI
jgi:hypothetical protein